MPLNIFEDRYIAMIEHAMKTDRIIGMIQPLKEEDMDSMGGERNGSSAPTELQQVGCLGRISAYGETGDGRVLITLAGICRFRLVSEQETDFPSASPKWIARISPRISSRDLVRKPSTGMDSWKCSGPFLTPTTWKPTGTMSPNPRTKFWSTPVHDEPLWSCRKAGPAGGESLSLRAETLIAITEMHLATGDSDGPTTLQ